MPLAVEVVNLKVIPNIVCSHRQNPSTLDLTFFFFIQKNDGVNMIFRKLLKRKSLHAQMYCLIQYTNVQ